MHRFMKNFSAQPPRRIVFSFDAIHPRHEGRGFLATER